MGLENTVLKLCEFMAATSAYSSKRYAAILKMRTQRYRSPGTGYEHQLPSLIFFFLISMLCPVLNWFYPNDRFLLMKEIAHSKDYVNT